MKNARFCLMGAAVLLTFATGCSNTVRYMTATKWTDVGGASAPAAAEGAPASGEASAPAADGGGASQRILYVTYWEGSCSSGVIGFGQGCSLGDSKIRRCSVKPDNSLACVDEAEATRAFARENEK